MYWLQAVGGPVSKLALYTSCAGVLSQVTSSMVLICSLLQQAETQLVLYSCSLHVAMAAGSGGACKQAGAVYSLRGDSISSQSVSQFISEVQPNTKLFQQAKASVMLYSCSLHIAMAAGGGGTCEQASTIHGLCGDPATSQPASGAGLRHRQPGASGQPLLCRLEAEEDQG